MSETTDGRRLVYAPNPTGDIQATTGSMICVNLAYNEEVEWIWTHLPNGSFVSGYSIKERNENK